MKRIRIATWAALLTCLFGVESLQAGLVLTKKDKITIGKVQDMKTYVVVAVKMGKTEGKLKYHKSKLIWFTTEPRVTSIYLGALYAYKKKDYEVARQLAKRSIKEEPASAQKAKTLLRYMSELDKTDEASEEEADGNNETVAEGDNVRRPTAGGSSALNRGVDALGGMVGASSGRSAPKVNVTPAMMEANKVYQATKGDLVNAPADSIQAYDDKSFAGARYYAVIFVGLFDPEYRDFARKMNHQRRLLREEYGDYVEFIFVPTDDDRTFYDQWMPKMKVSMPTLKFDAKNKSAFLKVKSGEPQIVIIDTKLQVVTKGKFDALQDLRDKLSTSN